MMESNGYERQLFNGVKALLIIAGQAYWKVDRHCGADMTDDCQNCRHFAVCQAQVELDKAIQKLNSWDC